jgi:hypothetical protein
MQEFLEPLAAIEEPTEGPCEAPAGLAERTCAMVAQFDEQRKVVPAGSFRPRSPAAAASPSPWSVADCVVVSGICLVAALLFFPAISHSRHIAQRIRCENNLREIGFALDQYSDKAGAGYFPWVPREGKRAFAGSYAPVLFDAGYLTRAEVLICPSSRFAESGRPFRVPTLSEIDNAGPRSLPLLRRRAGGSYGYSLGVIVNGQYRAPRNQGRTYFALMADAPSLGRDRDPIANHGGLGCNILFEDCHVRWGAAQFAGSHIDDPFRNHRGVVEAGVDENDAVIGSSTSPPFRYLMLRRSSGFQGNSWETR